MRERPVRPQASSDARVALEGFDLGERADELDVDAGRNESLIEYDLFPPMTGESSILLRGADGALVEHDLATGKRHPAGGDADGWCTRTLQYKQRIEGKLEGYVGQDGLFHCDANGRRIATGPSCPRSWARSAPVPAVSWPEADANRVYAVAVEPVGELLVRSRRTWPAETALCTTETISSGRIQSFGARRPRRGRPRRAAASPTDARAGPGRLTCSSAATA